MARDDKKPLETGTCWPLVLPDGQQWGPDKGRKRKRRTANAQKSRTKQRNKWVLPTRYFSTVPLPEMVIIHEWRMNDSPPLPPT